MRARHRSAITGAGRAVGDGPTERLPERRPVAVVDEGVGHELEVRCRRDGGASTGRCPRRRRATRRTPRPRGTRPDGCRGCTSSRTGTGLRSGPRRRCRSTPRDATSHGGFRRASSTGPQTNSCRRRASPIAATQAGPRRRRRRRTRGLAARVARPDVARVRRAACRRRRAVSRTGHRGSSERGERRSDAVASVDALSTTSDLPRRRPPLGRSARRAAPPRVAAASCAGITTERSTAVRSGAPVR